MSTLLTKKQENPEATPEVEPLMGAWVVFSLATFKE